MSLYQFTAIAGEIAEFTDRPRRDNTARNKAMAEELGNPLTIFNIGLSSGHIFDVSGICQEGIEYEVKI